MKNVSYSKKIEADGEIYNVPRCIDCSVCGSSSLLNSEVELSQNILSTKEQESDYKCTYQCYTCGHSDIAVVTLKKE